MAKKGNKKKKEVKEISMVSMLYMGIIVIVITAILGSVFPNLPKGVTTVLYIIGVAALVVYMLQVAFEKRTGKKELSESEIKALKKAKKK